MLMRLKVNGFKNLVDVDVFGIWHYYIQKEIIIK